jgi:peptidoglycan/xylan/chitin deacetylase (PgdA/CDA1 family)
VGLNNGGPPGSLVRERALRVLGPALTALCSVAAVHTDDPVLAITFDDGPDPVWTPVLLDVLDRHRLTATFFMLAAKAEPEATLAREVLDRGHEVGLHGIDHTRLPALSPAEARRVMLEGKQRLEAVLQRPVVLFRPAYGAQRLNEVFAARRLGLRTIIWNAWAEDWRPQAPAEVAERAASACRPGSILLLHDSYEPDGPDDSSPAPGFDRAEALEMLLQRLHGDGLGVTDVGRLLAGREPVLVPWLAR